MRRLVRRATYPELGAAVRCLACNGRNAKFPIEADGVIWICADCKAMGYYEQPQGFVYPKADYRLADGTIVRPGLD